MMTNSPIHHTENILRELIHDLMLERYGANWPNHLGVTNERLQQWTERRDEERKRRVGTVAEDRLLWYADFTDLWPIIKRNWDLFQPCFGNLKRLEIYLDRLATLRNPGAHSRSLLPFEHSLVDGITGEIRQQVTIFRSTGAGGSEPEHFPRIEIVRDSFGNQVLGSPPAAPVNQTNIVLRPGDEVRFSGSSWDPSGEPPKWRVHINRGPTLFEGDGEDVDCEWHVTDRDIAESVLITFEIRSGRAFHRHASGQDDRVIFGYRVLPLSTRSDQALGFGDVAAT